MSQVVPDSMTAAWKLQAKIGNQRPVVRATIQAQNLKRFEYDTAWVQGGTEDVDKHKTGHYTSILFGDQSQVRELPNIKSCSWERSIGQDAATCTLVLMNTDIVPLGSPKPNPASPDEFDRPGYLTYNRGSTPEATTRWGYTEGESGWNDVIVPDMVVKTYEGYGCDRTQTAQMDPNLVQSGTWMIDKVTYDNQGTITLEMRDVGRMLLEQIVFPPVVPKADYPLSWVRDHSENVDSRDAAGGSWQGNLKPLGSASSSNDSYIGKGFTNKPYSSYVTSNGGVDGHHASHVLPEHTMPRDYDLYWKSTGQDSASAFVWWQFDADTAMPAAGVRLRTYGGPYRAYISVHNGTKWIGKKKVPWKKNGRTGSPGNVDIGADIPFVKSVIADRFFRFDVIFARKYNAKKIRITFTRLESNGVGEHSYYAGLRDMQIYTAANLSDLSFTKGKTLKVVGNYGDYCADEETEILTRRGWLTWDQVQPGDETLAVNNEGRSEWTVIESIFREPRSRKMLGIESQVHSSLTTPDHRWLIRDSTNQAQWRTTETLKHGHSIPLTATRSDHPQEAKYVDPMVEMVAWFWTEGWTHAQGGCVNAYISQSRSVNPDYCDRIEAALTALAGLPSVRTGRNVSWSMRERSDGVVTYRLGQDLTQVVLSIAPNKVVSPEFLTSLTQAQLGLFINTSIDADGWRTAGVTRISQANEERIRSFEMACALAGVATSTNEHGGVWFTTLLKVRFFRPALARRKEVQYEGMIWCPTLKHHNWLARRHGKVFFTGNTHIVKTVCAWGGFYWPPASTKMDFQRVEIAGTVDVPAHHVLQNVRYVNEDRTLASGRVWGDFMRSGTTGVADLTVDMFDKKPLMDVINYVRDLLGFNFFIDEAGGVVWRMPNIWSLGNYMNAKSAAHDGVPANRGRYGRTSEIITLDENETLLSYQAVVDSTNIRDRIFVGNAVGGVGTVIKGFNPYPLGLMRVAGWTDQQFASKTETRVMADMISARSMFTYRTGQAVIPGYPKIQVDDQIRIFERVTSETYYHYVMGIKSELDMDSGEWTYTLDTHWLGEDPNDIWAVKVDELNTVTQQYLSAVGYTPDTTGEDNGD